VILEKTVTSDVQNSVNVLSDDASVIVVERDLDVSSFRLEQNMVKILIAKESLPSLTVCLHWY